MGGFRTTVMALLLLLLSSTVDAVISINEDGDTLQMKLAKYANHIERGLRLTEGIYGVPVPIDNLFDQISSLPSDDQGQNVDSECLNGSELSEMDMCLTPSQAGMFTSLSISGQAGIRKRRQASANGFSLWKNGVIPYVFNSTFPSQDRDAILGAMSEWEKTTCISFRPANRDDTDVVVFRDGRRCSTNIGHIGGEQIVTLAKNCRSKRILIHELGHVIGLIHEHQRHDRDKYVKVLLENVRNMSQERYQFSKLLSGSITDKAVKYDYTSVMHYGKNYFAKSPELTTLQTTETVFQDVIGRAEKPSFGDTETVNRLYKCSADCPPTLQCQESCYLDNVCTCRCPAVIDKLYLNGTGPYRNSLLDSTCEFFASRGECTGQLKDTVRPLCAKTCQIHQARRNTSATETWTQAPPSNTNHVQSKPGGSLWGTRPDSHRLRGMGRNNLFNNDINSISDVNFLRNTEARLGMLQNPAALMLQQQGVSSQQPYVQDHQSLPMPNMHSQASHQLQQDILNSLLNDNLRAAMQQSHVTHTSTDSSLLRSLILSHSYNDKTSRSINPDHNSARFLQQVSQQSGSSNVNPRHVQETTKSPSTILKHFLSGESVSRHDPVSGLSIWLRLSNASQQRQRSQQQQQYHQQQHEVLRKRVQNYHGNFQMAPTTVMPHLDRHTLQGIFDVTNVKVSGGQPAGGTNNWQVDAGIANRNSESSTFNSQVTEMRNGALPDPYHPTGQHSVLPSGDFGVAEQRQKLMGSNQMGPIAVGIDRVTGVVTSVDFTGPEVGQSGATVPGIIGTLNNSLTGPDSGRNLQTTGPSFMKQGVLPQNLVVSEQNPPMGNPVEQVFNEPWNLQVQETAPLIEVQPVRQAFQYYEPHQPQNNFDPIMSQSSQFDQPQQLAWDALGSPGSSVVNTEQLMDSASFQQYQEHIDQRTLESLQSPQMVQQQQDIVPADSNNGHVAGQQLPSLFQMINMHLSFTDPFADNITSVLENVLSDAKQNFSAVVSELSASQNLNNTGHNAELDAVYQDSKHVPTTDSLNDTSCCPVTNISISTENYNDKSNIVHPQPSLLKALLHVDSSPPDLPSLTADITFGSRYLNWVPGQPKPVYLFTSKFSLHKQNGSSNVQNHSAELVFPNERTVKANVSGYEKHTVYPSTTTGDPARSQHSIDTAEVIEQAKAHLMVDSAFSVQLQTQQPVSQIHSGIIDNNHRQPLPF